MLRQQRKCAADVDGHDFPHKTRDGNGFGHGGYGKCRKCGLVALGPDDDPDRDRKEKVA